MIKAFLTEKRQPIPTVKIVSADSKKPRVIDLAKFDSTTMKTMAGAGRRFRTKVVHQHTAADYGDLVCGLRVGGRRPNH